MRSRSLLDAESSRLHGSFTTLTFKHLHGETLGVLSEQNQVRERREIFEVPAFCIGLLSTCGIACLELTLL